MRKSHEYFVYIMTNQSNRVLYTGVTNNIVARVEEHKTGRGSVFTSKYRIKKLVYFEMTNYIQEALTREKQIKAGSRQKKIELITSTNPEWKDLYEDLI